MMIDVANLASRFLSLCRFCIFYEPWANGSSLIQVWAGVCAEQAMSASLRGLLSAEDGDHDSNQRANRDRVSAKSSEGSYCKNFRWKSRVEITNSFS